MKNETKKKISYYIILVLCIAILGTLTTTIAKQIVRNSVKDTISQTTSTNPVQRVENEEKNNPADSGIIDEDAAGDQPAMSRPDVEAEPSADPVKEFKPIKPVKGSISTPFSINELLFSETFGDWRIHTGIDITADLSEPVLAIADGVVEDVYVDPMQGIVIIINHQNGYKSFYKNLSTDKMVKKGESVTEGQTISGIGETGIFEAAMPYHLHFEMMKDDGYINPQEFIK